MGRIKADAPGDRRAPRRHREPVRRRRDHGAVRRAARAPRRRQRRAVARRARAAPRRRTLRRDAAAGSARVARDAHRHRHRPRRRPAQRRARRRLRAAPATPSTPPRVCAALAARARSSSARRRWRQVARHFDGRGRRAGRRQGQGAAARAVRIRRRAHRAAGLARRALVGRDEELREFRALAEACAERRRGRVVIVRGDPGVGKSRLVAEFVAVGALARLLACHAAAVLDFGAETGRDAMRSSRAACSASRRSADERERRAAVERASARTPRSRPSSVSSCTICSTVASPPELRALAAAMSTAAREQGSLARAVRARARCGPRSAAAARRRGHPLGRRLDSRAPRRARGARGARQPLLLVLTTRFAGDPTAGAWRTALHGAPLIGIDLGPLTDDESLRLADALVDDAGRRWSRSCVERAEGNPLFLLAVAARRRRSGAGEPARVDPGAGAHPHGPARARRQGGAAGGGGAGPALRARCAAPRSSSNPRYDWRVLGGEFSGARATAARSLFCHALIRDGAYASLLHARRRGLHARAAELVRRARSGARRRALRPRRRSARGRVPISSRAALDAAAVPLSARRSRWSSAASRSRTNATTRFALLMAARPTARRARPRRRRASRPPKPRCDAAAQPLERAQALIAMAAGMRLNDRIADGLAALDEAEPLADRRTRARARSRLHHLRGNLLFPLGRASECVRRARARARRCARAAGSPEAEAAALGGTRRRATTCKGGCARRNRAVPRVRRAGARHGFGPARGREPVDDRLDRHAIWRDRAMPPQRGREAIELAMRASQPRAEIMARSSSLGRRPDPRPRSRRPSRSWRPRWALVSAVGAQAIRGTDARRAARVRAAPRRSATARASRRARTRHRPRSTAWGTSDHGCTACAP